MLDINKNKENPGVKEFVKYLLDHCPDQVKRKQLLSALNGDVGLILNEHVVNLPFEASQQLHKTLFDEYRELLKKGGISFLKNFIIVCSVYEVQEESGINQMKKKSSKSQILFKKMEEEFYYHRACVSFPIENPNQSTYDGTTAALDSNVRNYKLVVVFSLEKLKKILKSMETAQNHPDNKSSNFNPFLSE